MQSFTKHASVWYPGPLTYVSPFPGDLNQQPSNQSISVFTVNFAFLYLGFYALGNEFINK